MKPTNSYILTINGGSSSIKFSLYGAVNPLKRGLYGKVDRIGMSGTNLTFNEPTKKQPESCNLAVADHKSAANALIDWLEKQIDFKSVKAVGHRVVHGMKHTEPEIVTKKLLDELCRISPNDPDHLPREIELIKAFRQRHPKLTQVACFDTAFHQTMPRVAKLLPFRDASTQRDSTIRFPWFVLFVFNGRTRAARPTRRPRKVASSSRISATAQVWPPCVTVKAWTPAWASLQRRGW